MMANRDFNHWLSTMKDSIATWSYYTDFEKVYKNVDGIKVELNILNSLIGSKNIENDFISLIENYPNVLRVIPILLAKRESELKINDAGREYLFNFKHKNLSNDDFCLLMRRSGLFNLVENRIIGSLVDYVYGVEVGMDTNARKNRTGDAMEDLVESYLEKAGLIRGLSFFKEMYRSEIEQRFHIDLSGISNDGKTEKRFDFVIKAYPYIYGVECNFYGGGGSKLNETARSYKNLALEAKDIKGFKFIWITDGVGWNDAKHNLEETFDVLEDLYNLDDLDNGALEALLKKDRGE